MWNAALRLNGRYVIRVPNFALHYMESTTRLLWDTIASMLEAQIRVWC